MNTKIPDEDREFFVVAHQKGKVFDFCEFYVEIFVKIIYNKNVWDDFPKNFIKNSNLMLRIGEGSVRIRCREEGYTSVSTYFALIGREMQVILVPS